MSDLVREWVPLAVALIILGGYSYGSWRRGTADSWKETVDLQSAELNTFKEQNARLAHELAEAREMLAQLKGAVEQLQRENAELRAMVMLEKVPPALAETLAASTRVVMEDVAMMHDAQVDQLTEVFREMLHPVAQGVSRLLTEQGGS